MRTAVTLLALALLSTTLAGCIGGEDGDEEALANATLGEDGLPLDPSELLPEHNGHTASADPGQEPAWVHGDWWIYDITFDLGFGTLISGETKIVVHDTTNGYKVAAADRGAGVANAHFDMFFVGDVGLDLSSSIFGTQFQMFQFPLEDGATWSTSIGTFNGSEPITMTARAVDAAGDPAGSTPGFEITGATDGGSTVTYTYSPLARWVTSFTMDIAGGPNGGLFRVLDMTLKDHGSNFEGTFRTIQVEELYQRLIVPIAPDPAFQPIPPADTVNIGEGYAFVNRFVGIFPFGVPPVPSVAAAAVVITDPANTPETFTSTGEPVVSLTTYDPAVPGDWHVGYAGAGTYATFVGFWGYQETIIEFNADSHAFHS